MTIARVPGVAVAHCRARAYRHVALCVIFGSPLDRFRSRFPAQRYFCRSDRRPEPGRAWPDGLERNRPGFQIRLPVDLGPGQFLLAHPAAPATGLGCAVSWADPRDDPAVAAQVRHRLDDCQFPRRLDHQRRHDQLYSGGDAGPLSRFGHRVCADRSGAGAALVVRCLARAPAICASGLPRVPRWTHRRVARVSAGGVGGVLSGRLRVEVRPLRRPGDLRAEPQRIPGIDAHLTERLRTLPEATCAPAAKPPHIILVHDESSFDIRSVPGVKVPEGYGAHFRSFDGKARRFIAEGAGGPSWYTEYNVLAGLSARSFGRFAYYVTHIAAGRVERGLPKALRRCGYRTFSIYPASGAFMSAKAFQTTTGMQSFADQTALGTDRIEPDRFYLRCRLAHDRTRARQGADVPVRLSRREPLPVGLSLAARPDAGMEGSR